MRSLSYAALYRELCVVQGMDNQLLAEVLQLADSALAPEKCIKKLLSLLTSRQDGERIDSGTLTHLAWAGQSTTVYLL